MSNYTYVADATSSDPLIRRAMAAYWRAAEREGQIHQIPSNSSRLCELNGKRYVVLFSGGMRTQLPAIIEFVRANGDMGVVRQIESAGSVSAAAWLWGRGVERFGIPDVHPQGIALASSFMAARGGRVPGHTRAYASGGVISEPVMGWGLHTGRGYSFAERGPETVVPGTAAGGGSVPLIRADVLMLQKLDKLISVTSGQGQQFGQALRGSMSRGASRGYYG